MPFLTFNKNMQLFKYTKCAHVLNHRNVFVYVYYTGLKMAQAETDVQIMVYIVATTLSLLFPCNNLCLTNISCHFIIPENTYQSFAPVMQLSKKIFRKKHLQNLKYSTGQDEFGHYFDIICTLQHPVFFDHFVLVIFQIKLRKKIISIQKIFHLLPLKITNFYFICYYLVVTVCKF